MIVRRCEPRLQAISCAQLQEAAAGSFRCSHPLCAAAEVAAVGFGRALPHMLDEEGIDLVDEGGVGGVGGAHVDAREEILDRVWGQDYFGDLKIVDVNIRRLRLKIEDNVQEPNYITTVWGYGYKWGF